MTIDPRMIKARASLIQNQPFFGTLALYLTLVEDEAIETMAVDGESLFYATKYLDKLTANELKGMVAQAVMRCAHKHHVRRGNRNPQLWDDAGNYVVNPGLQSAGFTLPEGSLLNLAYNGLGAEEVYARLQAKNPPPPKGQQAPQGQPSTGGNPSAGGKGTPAPGNGPAAPASGPTGTPGTPAPNGPSSPSAGPQPGGTGLGGTGLAPTPPKAPGDGPMGGSTAPGAGVKVLDAKAPGAAGKAANTAEWERRVMQAVSVAQRAGKLPGFIESLVTAIKEPQVDWREELHRFIDAKTRTEHSWNRPNRRFVSSGFILPGTQADGIQKIGIYMDSSGSINKTLAANFFGQIENVMDLGAVELVVMIQADTRVAWTGEYRAGDTINPEIKGQGGTSFHEGFKWFEENEPDVAVVIMFTDLECGNDWGTDPGVPVLWAAYGYESRIKQLAAQVPFGEVIHVKED